MNSWRFGARVDFSINELLARWLLALNWEWYCCWWAEWWDVWFCRKHVWSNYALSYHNQKLLDESLPLQDFGIRNNSQVFADSNYNLKLIFIYVILVVLLNESNIVFLINSLWINLMLLWMQIISCYESISFNVYTIENDMLEAKVSLLAHSLTII